MNYDYREIRKIKFTDEDIESEIGALTTDERHKTVAHMDVDFVSGDAIGHFAKLAYSLDGRVKQTYNGLDIVVAKNDTEMRDQALYNLRYNSSNEDLRDIRARESGVQPKDSEM